MKMDILPKDFVHIFIKIIIVFILFNSSITQSSDVANVTEVNLVTDPSVKSVPNHSEINVYHMNKTAQQTNNETIVEVTKVLQGLQQEIEAHGKIRPGIARFSVLDYINKFVTKMAEKTSTNNVKDNNEMKSKEMDKMRYESVTMKTLKEVSTTSGNKRDETVMKIPRNISTLQGEVSGNHEKERQHLIPNTSRMEGKYLKQDLQDEWFPLTFKRMFADFQVKSKEANSLCNVQSSFYQTQLKNLSLWAVKMYESADTVPRGFIVGKSYQLGNFDECIAVRHPSYGIFGKYCLIEAHLNFSNKASQSPEDSVWEIFKQRPDTEVRLLKDRLFLSMCIPSGCHSDDLEYSLNSALVRENKQLGDSIWFEVSTDNCYAENQQPPPSWGFIITCVVFTSISLLVVGVSIYHLITYDSLDQEKSSYSFLMKTLLSFSMVKNIEKLFSESGQELKFLHGIKFLSMCLIIMGHRIFYYFQSAILDMQNILEKFHQLDYILVHFNIVDTFFTIGGFLTFYTLYDRIKKSGLKLLPSAILYRWLRLVPVYGVVISLIAIILPYVGNGPIYHMKIAKEAERCQENWWTNILFVSNYVNTAHGSCMIQSWYLSCDFHLFLLGLVILYAISKNETLGLRLLYVCFVLSMVIPFVVTWSGRYFGIMRITTSLLSNPIESEYFTKVYSRTHNRATCYLLGMMTSHWCFKLKEMNFKFSTKQLAVMSVVIYILMDFSQFYQWFFYVQDRPYYRLENAVYAAVHKTFWSAGICGIIIGFITTGYGILSPILNHSLYVPLSRLTYCVLLIHTNVQLVSIATARVPNYLTYKKMGWVVGGDILVSYVLGTVLYLLIEAPVGNLVDLFLKKEKSR